MKAAFNVTGMSCANCVSNVERAVNKINGVEEVNVNLIEEPGAAFQARAFRYERHRSG